VKVNQFTTAVGLAVSFSWDAPAFELMVTGFWLQEYVTPLGKPVSAKETEPVNPPPVVNVNASVALVPCITGICVKAGAKVRVGVAAKVIWVKAKIDDAQMIARIAFFSRGRIINISKLKVSHESFSDASGKRKKKRVNGVIGIP
jgi:hypothetical protein